MTVVAGSTTVVAGSVPIVAGFAVGGGICAHGGRIRRWWGLSEAGGFDGPSPSLLSMRARPQWWWIQWRRCGRGLGGDGSSGRPSPPPSSSPAGAPPLPFFFPGGRVVVAAAAWWRWWWPAAVMVVVAVVASAAWWCCRRLFFSRKMFAEYSLGLGIVFAECLTIDTRQNSLCC